MHINVLRLKIPLSETVPYVNVLHVGVRKSVVALLSFTDRVPTGSNRRVFRITTPTIELRINGKLTKKCQNLLFFPY